MFSLGGVISAILAYVAILFLVAAAVEKNTGYFRHFKHSAIVYAFSQAVYCSAWTYYASVGAATTSGILFLSIYLGPTLAVILWRPILTKMIRIKNAHNTTSIADLISTRYGKSGLLAGLTTVIALLGTIPYVALQMKAMISTAAVLMGDPPAAAYSDTGDRAGPILAILAILFTILFGLRRLNPTERHPGLMAALTVESIVKLGAFLVAGAFATFFVFDGFNDIFSRTAEILPSPIPFSGRDGILSLMTWLAQLILSFSAFLFLPRQFHVAVVENADPRHLRTASWAVPLYLLLFTLFVLPLALGSLLSGLPAAEADTFVLTLPLAAGHPALALFVFLGGISAGLGMIIVEGTAIATMVTNHLALPLISRAPRLAWLKRHTLRIRWLAASGFILLGYGFERFFGQEQLLISMGNASFAAILQFAPATLAGLFWRQANKTGAFLGIASGFGVWIYTVLVPVLARGGWISPDIIEKGLWGNALLRPEQLFGLTDIPALAHTVFWSLLFNVGLLVLGSLILGQNEDEALAAAEFVGATPSRAAAPRGVEQPALIDLAEKATRVHKLLSEYFGAGPADKMTKEALEHVGASHADKLSILQLADLQGTVERQLSAAIGAAEAHAAVMRARLIPAPEARRLSAAYADLLTELNVSPDELRVRIDYYREREKILTEQAGTFRILAEASQKLSSSLDYSSSVESVLRIGFPSLARKSLLYLLDHDPEATEAHHRFHAAAVEPEMEAAWVQALHGTPLEPGSLVHVAEAFETGQIVICAREHVEHWPPFAEPSETCRSSITIPLASRGRVFGTLSLFTESEGLPQVPGGLALFQEIGNRCAMAIDNAVLYRNAQHAVRAREEFLSVASHELRTPLTPLRSQIQLISVLLRRDSSQIPREKLTLLLESAERQITRMTRLINELLDLSRLRMGKMPLNLEKTELSGLVRETVEQFQAELRSAGCQVETFCDPQVIGRWDRLRIEEVLVNLLTNAMKYAPGQPITIHATDRGDSARLSVTDHGRGIPKEDQGRIFKRFERGASPRHIGGFGLGLYIADSIVRSHGGDIRVESEAGKGATFIVELPKRPPERS